MAAMKLARDFSVGLIALLLSTNAFAQDSRDFYAAMAAEWQTKYTESPGRGEINLHVDLTTLTASWDVTFKNLSGPPTSVKLYGPAQPGANGAAILSFAPRGAKSPLKGSAKLTEAQVQYLLYGWTYITITTAKFPLGEIRGQLDVRAPQEVTQ
jgi:hypothetical protein